MEISKKRNRKVFLSVLGTRRYQSCTYEFKDKYDIDNINNTVQYIQCLMMDIFIHSEDWTENDICYILLTKEAKKQNWFNGMYVNPKTKVESPNVGLKEQLSEMNLPCKVELLDIPDGSGDGDFFHIFNMLSDSLLDGDSVYFDITHGFRSLPMLVLVMMNYYKLINNIKIKSITYGDFFSKKLVDLMFLLEIQDFSFAAGSFMENGVIDINMMSESSKENITNLSKRLNGGKRPIDIIKRFNEKILPNLINIHNHVGITNAFRLLDGEKIIGNSQVQSVIENARSIDQKFNFETYKYVFPIWSFFKQIISSFDEYKFKLDSVVNGIYVAHWCLEHNLIQQALTILQESIISIVISVCSSEYYRESNIREITKNALLMHDVYSHNSEDFLLYSHFVKSPIVVVLSDEFETLNDLRNDFNHAGIRKNPFKSEEISKKIKELYYKICSKLKNFSEIDIHIPFSCVNTPRRVRKVFIAMLGLSNYNFCKYKYRDNCSDSTQYVEDAILNALMSQQEWTYEDKILILGTAQSRVNWDKSDDGKYENRLKAKIEKLNSNVEIEFIEIDSNQEEEVLLDVFKVLLDKVHINDELFLDITHSFRYFPMLGLVFANFCKYNKNAYVKGIYYGNYDGRILHETTPSEDIAQIYDLVFFSNIQDLSFYAAYFVKNGNIALLFRSLLSIPFLEKEFKIYAVNLLSIVEVFRTCRALDIYEGLIFKNYSKSFEILRGKLLEMSSNIALIDDVSQIASQAGCISRILDKVNDSLNGFSFSENTYNGIVASRWCLSHNLEQQAITLLEESITSVLLQKIHVDYKILENRSLVTSAIKSCFSVDESDLYIIKRLVDLPNFEKISKCLFQVKQYRNDINHMGLSNNPLPVDKIALKIEECINKFEDIVYP